MVYASLSLVAVQSTFTDRSKFASLPHKIKKTLSFYKILTYNYVVWWSTAILNGSEVENMT